MSLAWSSVKALSIPVGGTARDVKRVAVGGVEVWRKLPYDAEVEYIESTGTQYVDTGYVPKATTVIEYTFERIGDYDFGCASIPSWGSNGMFGIAHAKNAGGKWQFYCGTSYAYRYGSVTDSKTTLILRNGKAIVTSGGISTEYNFTGNFSNNNLPLYVFKINIGGTVPWNGSSRLYSLRISDNSTLVRDYIPVRVGSGANAVGCLYDQLGTGGQNPDGTSRNDGLYFRQGSGAFVVGPDANA